MDLIQSYILTAAKYDYSVYEKRILYRILETLQKLTGGKKLDQKHHVDLTLFKDYVITMPVKDFLKDENDENYARAKQALLSLNRKVIEVEDDKIWCAFNLIERVKIEKTFGMASFTISSEIAKAFIDFSKGFSKYELQTAMSFDSIYAMRFYELLSEQKHSITYSIAKLKIMFKIENNYKKPNDFIRFVIEPAKRELDAKSPYSFEFTPLKVGKAITNIMFHPVYNAKNRDGRVEEKKLQKATSLRHDLDKMVIDYLKQNYFFSDEEIKNNRDVFITGNDRFDLMYFLSEQKAKAEKAKNPKGWLINAIKKRNEALK
jgi:plasmid replication initiation protein